MIKQIKIILLSGLLIVNFGCQTKYLEPEKLATVIGPDYSLCGLCGGYFITIDSTKYRADLPKEFTTPKQQLLIRFKPRKGTAGEMLNWIDLHSIRAK